MFKTIKEFFGLLFVDIGIPVIIIGSLILITVAPIYFISKYDENRELNFVRQCKRLTNNQRATYVGNVRTSQNEVGQMILICHVPIPGIEHGYQIKTFEIQEN